MDEMIAVLRRIGFTESDCNLVREHYRNDLDGLAEYVLFMRAMFDDSHEYV